MVACDGRGFSCCELHGSPPGRRDWTKRGIGRTSGSVAEGASGYCDNVQPGSSSQGTTALETV